MADSVLERRELAGPYLLPAARRAVLLGAVSALGLPHVDLAPAVAGRDEWLAAAGQALGFPATFGANFDALYDSLCDRDLLPQPVLLLFIGHTAGLGEDGVDTLIAVLQAAADDWREQGRALWALFEAPGLDLDPLPR